MKGDHFKRTGTRLLRVMWLLVVIATASMIITLHISNNLTWFTFRSNLETNQLVVAEAKYRNPNHVIQFRFRGHESDSHAIKDGVQQEREQPPIISDYARRNYDASETANVTTTGLSAGGYSQFEPATMTMVGSKSSDIVMATGHSHFQKASMTTINSQSQLLYKILSTKYTARHAYGNKTSTHDTIRSSFVSATNVNFIKHGKNSFDEDTTFPSSENSAHITRKENSLFHSTKKSSAQAEAEFVVFDKPQQYSSTEASPTYPDFSNLPVLYDKLMQIEKASLLEPLVLLKGDLITVKHHLPLIEAAFRKFEVKVTYETTANEAPTIVGGDNRCIILCLNNTNKEDNCVITAESYVYQKVNIIPELVSAVQSPTVLCHKTEETFYPNSVGQLYGGQLPCYNYNSEFFNKGPNCDNVDGLWMVSENRSGTSRHYLPCGSGSLSLDGDNSRLVPSIYVPLPKDMLSLDKESPLVWQVKVLVTSMLPLRAYLHPAGLAWAGLFDFIHRKHQKNVSLHYLRELITELKDDGTALLSLRSLEMKIMNVVRLLEEHINNTAEDNRRICEKCFQLLDIVVVFDSFLQPIILQINLSNFTEQLSSLSDYLLEQNIIEDLAAMLVSKEMVSPAVLRAMIDLGVNVISDTKICDQSKIFCLGEKDITYLLDTRREQLSSRNWIRLFPSTVFSCGNSHPSWSSTKLKVENGCSQKPASPLEKLSLSIEEYFLCPSGKLDKAANMEFGLNKACVCHIFQWVSNLYPKHGENDYFGQSNNGKLSNISRILTQTCDNGNSSLPILSAIHIYPYIQLFPEFSPRNTEYSAYIDHQTTLVFIQGVPKPCGVQVRLDNKHSNSRWGNISLGLGKNTAYLLVVGRNHPEPNVLNIYKVNIYRQKLGPSFGRIDSHKGHYLACSLKQDCSMLLPFNASCGLQPMSQTWNEYMRHHLSLPSCQGRSMTGEWVVPCSDCHDELSCDWRKSIWQSAGCQEVRFSHSELKTCFSGKKVLFIGDSTNRGIFYYIVERLNGSLHQWTKTHSISVYPNLNNGQTLFGFAYYPQFWLKSEQRPILDEVLVKLLNREGIRNYKVVVKGLGAGFHQPVSDVHQLSQEEQNRLYSQNKVVLSYAKSLGFSTVDTFSMTMARYKDFLQGKCACHFHQVPEKKTPIIRKLSKNISSLGQETTKYHVEGDINTAYSEMVINRICSNNHR